MMDSDKADKMLTAIGVALVSLPETLPIAIPEINSDPHMKFILLVFAAIGLAIVKQSQPVGGASSLSDADVKRIAAEQERQRMARVQKVREAGQRG